VVRLDILGVGQKKLVGEKGYHQGEMDGVIRLLTGQGWVSIRGGKLTILGGVNNAKRRTPSWVGVSGNCPGS